MAQSWEQANVAKKKVGRGSSELSGVFFKGNWLGRSLAAPELSGYRMLLMKLPERLDWQRKLSGEFFRAQLPGDESPI